METKLSEQEIIRREKMNKLIDLGVDPFGSRFTRDYDSEKIKNEFKDYSIETKDELLSLNNIVSIAGRIMTKRGQGKAGFMNIQDRSGNIQVYVRQDQIGVESYQIFKASDIGDIVGIKGIVFITNTGQLSVKAQEYTHLTKALRPLPEKYHGLQDVEEARRRRYVDLITNEESKQIAITRPKIIRALQRFFDNKGFIEVETPILQPILGGASARPFTTHHNALDMPFYLRIATELPLKKLLVGGLEAVYEIGRLFRNEGMDSTHNPEFTSVEAYLAYSDMEGMMDLVEDCFKYVANEILGTLVIPKQDIFIDLGKPWKKMHMVDAIKDITKIDFWKKISLTEAKVLAKSHNIETPKHFTGVGHIINAFFEKYVEDSLIDPTIIYGHPLEISPLAKKNKNDERFTDRFEFFIDKKEYGNAFSELNDPIDQKERFEKQLAEKELGNAEANEMDIDYVEALEYGMPPAGGIGIGIDRMVMLLTNTTSIRDILLFPHMKNK